MRLREPPGRTTLSRALLLAVSLAVAGPSPASSQSTPDTREVAQGAWLVVGTVPLFGRPLVEQAVVQLSESDAIPGAVVLGPQEAIRRLALTHSQEPVQRTTTEISELEQCARDMGVELARGRVRGAGAHLARCEELLGQVRRRYDVERESEQRVFRVCLVMLQGMLQSGPAERARQHAELCRLDAIDLPVERTWASPEVQALMAEVDAELASRPQASIRVIGPMEVCDVWLRGRMIGRTPLIAHGFFPGQATLQLLCDDQTPGRIHHVTLRPGENLLEIDRGMEQALRTERAIVMDYGGTWIESVRRLGDARVLATATSARIVVLVTLLPHGRTLRLDRIDFFDDGSERVNATVLVPVRPEGNDPIDPAVLARAATALTELRGADLRRGAERPIEFWTPPRLRSRSTTIR